MADGSPRLAELVAQVATAYFTNSHVAVADIPAVMRGIAEGLVVSAPKAIAAPEAEPAPTSEPAAVSPKAAPRAATKATPEIGRPPRPSNAQIKSSVRHDALISFEDGRPYKMLRLHLKKLGLTPEQYRLKWGLPEDYPMTAASHSAARSAIAKRIGFGGRKPRSGRRGR